MSCLTVTETPCVEPDAPTVVVRLSILSLTSSMSLSALPILEESDVVVVVKVAISEVCDVTTLDKLVILPSFTLTLLSADPILDESDVVVVVNNAMSEVWDVTTVDKLVISPSFALTLLSTDPILEESDAVVVVNNVIFSLIAFSFSLTSLKSAFSESVWFPAITSLTNRPSWFNFKPTLSYSSWIINVFPSFKIGFSTKLLKLILLSLTETLVITPLSCLTVTETPCVEPDAPTVVVRLSILSLTSSMSLSALPILEESDVVVVVKVAISEVCDVTTLDKLVISLSATPILVESDAVVVVNLLISEVCDVTTVDKLVILSSFTLTLPSTLPILVESDVVVVVNNVIFSLIAFSFSLTSLKSAFWESIWVPAITSLTNRPSWFNFKPTLSYSSWIINSLPSFKIGFSTKLLKLILLSLTETLVITPLSCLTVTETPWVEPDALTVVVRSSILSLTSSMSLSALPILVESDVVVEVKVSILDVWDDTVIDKLSISPSFALTLFSTNPILVESDAVVEIKATPVSVSLTSLK